MSGKQNEHVVYNMVQALHQIYEGSPCIVC